MSRLSRDGLQTQLRRAMKREKDARVLIAAGKKVAVALLAAHDGGRCHNCEPCALARVLLSKDATPEQLRLVMDR